MVLIRGRRADRRWTGTVVEYSAKKWDSPGLRCAGARSVAHAAGVQRTSRRQLAEKACSWPHARASAPKLVGLSVASLLPAIGRSLRVRHEHFTDPDWRVRSVEGPTRHGRSAAHVRRCDRQMSMQKVPRWSRFPVPKEACVRIRLFFEYYYVRKGSAGRASFTGECWATIVCEYGLE